MPKLNPTTIPSDAPLSEKVLFYALEKANDIPDWICMHGLHQYKVVQGVEAEGDFVILIPNRGIVVIESKGATSVGFVGDEWQMTGVAEKASTKSPIQQAERVRNNVKALISTNDIDAESLPIARIAWFPKLDPMSFDDVGNKGMEFYPWEILFKRDLDDVAGVISEGLRRETAEGPKKGRTYDPEKYDVKQMNRIRDILRTRAKAAMSKDGLSDVRAIQMTGATSHLSYIWDAVSGNKKIYIEGPAGTGKSALLKYAADTFAAEKRKVLVACYSKLLAEELAIKFEHQPNVDVFNIADLFLMTARLSQHKNGDDWYQVELPTKAKTALSINSDFAIYDVICVDEFQDLAPYPNMVDAIFRYYSGDSPIEPVAIVAGDHYQQLMNSSDAVWGLQAAKDSIGEFTEIYLSRNCRQAPGLRNAIFQFLDWDSKHLKSQLNEEVDWSFDVVRVKEGKELASLANRIEKLLETNKPEQIRILSALRTKQSLLTHFFAREPEGEREIWLRSQLRHESTKGKIRWRSIPKFKGLEEDVVIITDVTKQAKVFAENELKKKLDALLYVGLTRARFQTVLMISDDLYPKAKSSHS